jgi:hypothetical protein
LPFKLVLDALVSPHNKNALDMIFTTKCVLRTYSKINLINVYVNVFS